MGNYYWQQKVCLITGASSGLGYEIALALADRGAHLVIVARGKDRLESAAAKLRQRGAEVLAIAGDVAWQEDVDMIATEIQDKFARLDLLCNCAGRSVRGEILETSADDFQQLLDVNFLSAVRTIQTLSPLLIKQRGHVVNIGSLASHVAPRFLAAYPASKFALAAYSQQLRLELTDRGLHVLLVCPGPIEQSEGPLGKLKFDNPDIPLEARKPGGGARVSAIDPQWLARRILAACQKGHVELVIPRKARLLFVLSQISPRLGDWLLRKFTSG
jgi:short-subunit dehydrogenase